ncbi:MAG: hypothetical protein UEJ45_09170, partial [Peptococcaceae bacterium]|nr:hypothetical protein [Peptococcaceae bacterium]
FISLGCLIFKEHPPPLGDSSFIIPPPGFCVNTFFKVFLETFEAVFFTCRLWLSAHPPTFMCYT